jgi:hypothetical protein
MCSAPVHDDRPLGLTVHSLPEPSGQLQTAAVDTRAGRLRMLLVMLVCAAPIIASYLTYYVIRPEGRRNFGELIEPQRPLPSAQATTMDKTPVALSSLKGQWLFISVAGGACELQCQQNLYLQRQLREGLGKEKDRLDWVWLVDDDAQVSESLLPALKNATVLRVPAQAIAAWLEPAKGHALGEHLFLVDPLGNWMMRFPAGLNAETAPQAKRDLDRLLRAAQSWDRPGRD